MARHLTHTQLPGLSSLDQMYLLALADTVANTKVDFSENDAADVAVKKGKYVFDEFFFLKITFNTKFYAFKYNCTFFDVYP